jgi:hypothetical protein
MLNNSLPILESVAPIIASSVAYSVKRSRAGAQLIGGAPRPSLPMVRFSSSTACGPREAWLPTAPASMPTSTRGWHCTSRS